MAKPENHSSKLDLSEIQNYDLELISCRIHLNNFI